MNTPTAIEPPPNPRRPLRRGLRILGILALGLGLALPTPAQTAASVSSPSATTNAPATNAPSKFRSPDDGWLDLSAFLDETYGFVPIVPPRCGSTCLNF
jgi:hypothetical protein